MELNGISSDDFVETYRYHYPRLVRALMLSGASQQEAEDAAQEAFARTLRHWRRVRRGPNPAGYPYRIAFRLLKRRTTPTEPLARASPPPDDAALVHIGVRQTLAALPPRQRQCAVCCFVLGFTPLETAGLLGIKPATVRKHLDAARAAFGAVLRA